MSPRMIIVLMLALGFAQLGQSLTARAEPLDKDACAKLKAEHAKMLTPEMKQALAQGPDWVKNHLDNASLNMVRDFLIVEEKLDFQCRTGRYIKDYVHPPMTLPLRRPPPPDSNQKVVSTSQARAD